MRKAQVLALDRRSCRRCLVYRNLARSYVRHNLAVCCQTTNAIRRLHERFKRRTKTQTVRPSAETAAMLFWAPLASAQIIMRKIDGWKTLSKSSAQLVDLSV
jgi:transposase-like protein